MEPASRACSTNSSPEAKADGLMDAAKAIMTTDTYPKIATARVKLGEAEVTINGIAKGAGMIAPDMATMLSFVFTDAPIAPGALQTMLSKSVERSFNAITVDSDTSTSDTLMLFATGAAKDAPPNRGRSRSARCPLPPRARQAPAQSRPSGRARRRGRAQVHRGQCRGRGNSRKAAKRIALSIANSPLVKTACGGEDANWGRVVMAVGKAGEKAERDKLDIWFGNIRVAHQGLRDPAYDEAATSAYMKRDTIVDHSRSRDRARTRHGLDLRSDQGICRDQRRLSLVKLLLVVAAALVDADGRVLLAQRPKGKQLEGLWEFPGGKIDPKERPEDALIRELREELGIAVKAPCLAPLTFASHAYARLPSADAALRLPQVGGLR